MKRSIRTMLRAALATLALAVASPQAGAEELAKNLFGAKELPAATEARAYGF